MSEILTFATANAHMGRLFKRPGGLQALADCDAVGFQEVHLERDNAEERLQAETDLVIVSSAPEYGLAIAVHKHLEVVKEYRHTLEERGPIAKALIAAEASYKPAAFRTRARGVQAVTIETTQGLPLHFVNTHPTIPFKWRQRERQVRRIPVALAHLTGPLVLAQDGNHCPGPRKADLAMRRAVGLKAADIGNEPTYVLERSKHAWLGILPTLWTLQFDDILYRGLEEVETEVIDIDSDHRLLKSKLLLKAGKAILNP